MTLPYVRAVLQETFRVSCLTFIGVPRYSKEDIRLQDGTFIPKNTTVMSNSYQIMNDETYWKEPERFNPSRFLDDSGAFHADERVIVFGLGKRYCLGQSLAEKEFFLFFTIVMQQFKIFPSPGSPLPGHSIYDAPGTGVIRKTSPHTVRMKSRL